MFTDNNRELYESMIEKYPDTYDCISKIDNYFYQEYQTTEQGYRLRQIIESEINSLDSNAFDFGLYPIPDDKEKYIFEDDRLVGKE